LSINIVGGENPAILTDDNFTLNAAETIYLNGTVNNTETYYITWQAYRVKA